MGERAAYSRVYWEIVDDPKFLTIYDQDTHLAAWLRLLLIADQAHPASAHLPSSVRRSSVTALSEAGLIDLLPGSRYRIHGLDAERQKRREFATTRGPDGQRLGTGRIPDGDRTVPERSRHTGPKTRLDETRQAETDARDDERWDAPEMPALQWLAQHGCDIRHGNGYHTKLITAVEVHGADSLVEMFERLAAAGTRHGDVKGFLFGAIDALNAKTRPNLTALQSVDAEERVAERSDQIRERMIARRLDWYRNSGQWDPEWGPKPETVQ